MSDPFNILGKEFDVPPTFEEAVREAVDRLQDSIAQFEEGYSQITEEAYTEEEWRVVERAVNEVAEAVERAEEGYVAVQFDSHAWYRIIESLAQIHQRLESALGVIERVRDRERSLT